MATKKKKVDWRVIVGGMVCLTIVEVYAMSQGINGLMFAAFAAIIGGAIGVVIPTPSLE